MHHKLPLKIIYITKGLQSQIDKRKAIKLSACSRNAIIMVEINLESKPYLFESVYQNKIYNKIN